jgi:hypothetical protein
VPRKAYTRNTGPQKSARAMLDVAEGMLEAELALAEGRHEEAIALQGKVIGSAAKIDAREPPGLGDGTRLALGHMQAQAKRWTDSEATYREALAEHPGSGWALRGLVRALDAQGKSAEAAKYRNELERSWGQVSERLRKV